MNISVVPQCGSDAFSSQSQTNKESLTCYSSKLEENGSHKDPKLNFHLEVELKSSLKLGGVCPLQIPSLHVVHLQFLFPHTRTKFGVGSARYTHAHSVSV